MKIKINKLAARVLPAVLISGVALLALVSGIRAATVTYVLNPTVTTNTLAGPLLIKKVIVVAGSSNATVTCIDAPAYVPFYTNASYTSITQYGTNLVTSYTNFFGAVNTLTNFQLANITNTTAASTNNFPTRFTAAALAGATTVIDDTHFFLLNGLYLTNNAVTGTATITIEYQK